MRSEGGYYNGYSNRRCEYPHVGILTKYSNRQLRTPMRAAHYRTASRYLYNELNPEGARIQLRAEYST